MDAGMEAQAGGRICCPGDYGAGCGCLRRFRNQAQAIDARMKPIDAAHRALPAPENDPIQARPTMRAAERMIRAMRATPALGEDASRTIGRATAASKTKIPRAVSMFVSPGLFLL